MVISYIFTHSIPKPGYTTILTRLIPVDFESGSTSPVHREVNAFPWQVCLEAKVILRCFRITLEILVIVVTINAISIQVCINDITIPDITLADSLFRIELISGIRHGLQPFHIIFRTDHPVRRPSFRIYRTIGIKIVSIAFIYVQHIKFIDHVPFQNTLQVSCWNLTQIGIISGTTIRILLPSADKFSFVFGYFILVVREVSGYAVRDRTDPIIPT